MISRPNIKIVSRKIGSLVPFERNSRTHSGEQIAQIAASIEAFGWTNPLLIDEADGVIAGHGRLLAAKSLELGDVPCIVLAGLSEAEKRALVIADNKLALNAGWDTDLLAAELKGLGDDGFDLALLGFSTDELTDLLADRTQGLTDEDDLPDLPTDPVSVLGDVWVLGNHRIICGDSTNPEAVNALLSGEKPHLMVTDPPYGVEYDPAWRNRVIRANGTRVAARAVGIVENDDRADWTAAWALFPGNVVYCWHGGLHSGEVQASLEDAGFAMRAQIIWNKNMIAIGRGDYHWKHEPCWYAVRKGKTGRWASDRKQSTVWDIDKPQKSETGHSTQKPVECMRRPIINNSKAGDLVYEPFSGSGTTIIACEQEGRACRAIELNPAYVDLAVTRWQEFTGKQALHADGRSFDSGTDERKVKEAA